MPSDASGSSEFPRALPAALSRTAVRPARASRTARPFWLRPGESLETRRLLAAGVGDLQVALRVGTSTITSDVVRQYSAAAIGSAGWGTVDTSGKAATFRYVETHQFAIPDNDLGSPIAVKVAERDPKNNGINGFTYPGFAAFWKGEALKTAANSTFFRWGEEIPGLRVSANAPVQMTIIPFDGKQGYMPSNAYAIWLSPRTTNTESNHHTVSVDVGWNTADGVVAGLGLVKPHWKYDATAGTLAYVGSLDRYNAGGELHGKPVALTLGDQVTLDLPLTNSFAVMQLPKTLTNAQKGALLKLNGRSDLSVLSAGDRSALGSLRITSSDNYLHVRKPDLASPVHVDGLGRIDGYGVHRLPTFSTNTAPPDQTQLSWNTRTRPATLLEQMVTGQYMIRSALVEIHTTEPIRVEGISVSYGPVRHQESIQLRSGKATTLFDVKTPGTFRGASDGPVVLSPGASLSYLYLHHSDDAIKVFADNQHFREITLIQGNAGAAVDLGAYGCNTPITTGASVNGVYVHRIMQNGPGYDGLGGVITTRNRASGAEISNVRIADVHIVDLGKRGPNVYFRKTAIGFVPGGPFGGSSHKTTTISHLSIEPFRGLKPQDASQYSFGATTSYYVRGGGRLLYNLGVGQAKAFPGSSMPKAPVGQQFGVFVNVVDRS